MPLTTDAGTLKIITYVAVVHDGRILLVEYVEPPNPEKPGWWIPAPEVDFGEHPAHRARSTLESLGLDVRSLTLAGVESFTVGGAWHLIVHYRADASSDARPTEAYRRHAWFGPDDLPPDGAFAHGEWERRVALERLAEVAAVPG